MANSSYDIITVGGGLGGAALAKVMAAHGARVLVLERETQFKDRVRALRDPESILMLLDSRVRGNVYAPAVHP